MNEDELKSLLKHSECVPERQAMCPEDAVLAVWVEGQLGASHEDAFELHLADCTWCRERVGILCRARSGQRGASKVQAQLYQPGGVESDSSTKRHWRLRTVKRWAAAAVLVLALGFAFNSLDDPASRSLSDVREIRNLDPLAPGIAVSWPTEGATFNQGKDTFRWHPIPDSLYYQVRIISDEGDLVWQQRVDKSEWGLPDNLKLVPDTEYFVRVDAYLAEAKTMNSDYVPFRVGERP